MKTEVAEFIKREEPPEVDSDGLYGTQGGVILFQMVNQQIDLATESGQGAILARVVGETNRVMPRNTVSMVTSHRRRVQETDGETRRGRRWSSGILHCIGQ